MRRHTVDPEQLTQLKNIVARYAKERNQPAFVAFDQRHGAGLEVEITNEYDNNAWVVEPSSVAGHTKTNKTYWLDWLLFTGQTLLPPVKQEWYFNQVFVIGNHPISALHRLVFRTSTIPEQANESTISN